MEARKLASGALVDQTGIWDIHIDRYHEQCCDGPSISSGGLRTIWSKSPAHFWFSSHLNPNRVAPPEKPEFALGRLAHKLLIEGRDGFSDEYVVRPDQWSDWRTRDAREWRDRAVGAGLTVITRADLEAVEGMAASLAAHPLVKAGILDGVVEKSLIYRCEETSVWLKSRPDVIPNASGDLVDLKTCQSVATDDLRRSMGDYGYQMQAALAAAALKAAAGIEFESFTFVWVEKAPPYCVRVTTMTAEDLLRGDMQNKAATRIFAECLRTGRWPGPGGDQQDAEFLPISPWAAKSIDERLELLKAEATEPQPFPHAAE